MLTSPLVCVETTEEHKNIASRIQNELILADNVSSGTFDIPVFHCFLLRDLSDDTQGEPSVGQCARSLRHSRLLESSYVRECSTDIWHLRTSVRVCGHTFTQSDCTPKCCVFKIFSIIRVSYCVCCFSCKSLSCLSAKTISRHIIIIANLYSTK